jgi:hypothetical protein
MRYQEQMSAYRPIAERFAEKFTPEPNTGCYLWLGACWPGGYGIIGGERGSHHRQAHRVAWELAHGEPPPDDMEVCHTCDQPCCVNDRHLFLGTHQDNMDDRGRKGRTLVGRGDRHWQRLYPERRMVGDRNGTHTKPETVRRGEEHHNAKLTAEKVMSIRERFAAGGVTKTEIGREHNVTEVCIDAIVVGRSWTHVGGPLTTEPRLASRAERERVLLGEPMGPKPHRAHGEQARSAKLTADQVREFRRRFMEGETNISAFAREAGVSNEAMRCIIHRKTWRHVE